MPETKWQWIGFLAYAGIEYFLGKSDKVKAGSLVELIINLFIKKEN